MSHVRSSRTLLSIESSIIGRYLLLSLDLGIGETHAVFHSSGSSACVINNLSYSRCYSESCLSQHSGIYIIVMTTGFYLFVRYVHKSLVFTAHIIVWTVTADPKGDIRIVQTWSCKGFIQETGFLVVVGAVLSPLLRFGIVFSLKLGILLSSKILSGFLVYVLRYADILLL